MLSDPKPFQRGRYRAVPFLDGDRTLYRIEIDAMLRWLPYGEGDKLVLVYDERKYACRKVSDLADEEARK